MAKKATKKAVKKTTKKAMSVTETPRDEVIVDRLARPSMALVREVLRFQGVPACIDPFPELIAEVNKLYPPDQGNRHATELAKWQYCWTRLIEEAFLTSLELKTFETFIEQSYEITITTGAPPCACPPELQTLMDRLQEIISALAYVAEKLAEEEAYNERNANCFLAAEAWHADYEEAQTELDSLVKELINDIIFQRTHTHNLGALADVHVSPNPSDLRKFRNKFQKLCDLLSLADESHKETLIKELNLISILKNFGWADLSRIRFKKQGIVTYTKEDVKRDSRNMKNQVESLRKHLSAKEK